MRTRMIITFIVAALLVLVLLHAQVYNGLNKGIVIDAFGHSYGVELVGQPGFFEGDY